MSSHVCVIPCGMSLLPMRIDIAVLYGHSSKVNIVYTTQGQHFRVCPVTTLVQLTFVSTGPKTIERVSYAEL